MTSFSSPLMAHCSSFKLRRMPRNVLIGLFCLNLAAVGGAPGEEPGKAPAVAPGAKIATHQVSAAKGGTVTSPSGALTLSIPPAALEKDTSITIEELPPGEGPVIGPTFKLGPEGLKFKKPATLNLRFKPADVPKGFEKEDVALAEVNPESQQASAQAMTAAGLIPSVASGLNFLESEVNVASGTVSARIGHFSRYAARAHSSYTLGSGQHLIIGGYDFYKRWEQAEGSGYAKAQGSAATGGEFFETVGAKMGVWGVGQAGILMGKFFRVKAGKKGEKSTSNGVLVVNIDHAAALTANDYLITFGVVLIDWNGQPAGKAYSPLSGLNSGFKVMFGQASQVYFTHPLAPPQVQMMQGPSYKPGTLSVWFDQCQWKAGQFYAVFLSLITSVGGNPGDRDTPATGGEVRWNGPFTPGHCIAKAFQIEG